MTYSWHGRTNYYFKTYRESSDVNPRYSDPSFDNSCPCGSHAVTGRPSKMHLHAYRGRCAPHVTSKFPVKTMCRRSLVVSRASEVLGLGQAMVDFGCTVDTSLLESLEVEKGSRELISISKRTEILNTVEEYQLSAGGSLSNTLIDLARLVEAAEGTSLSTSNGVEFAGLVGNDALGGFYRSQMKDAGVSVVDDVEGECHATVNTGTVIVLTTEDAARTMFSYLGTQNEVKITPSLEQSIKDTSILVIEGYMWELPEALDSILSAIQAAKNNGVRVAMTAGDLGVVERHGEKMWKAIQAGVDILFTNTDEAAALARVRPVGALPSQDRGSATSKAEAAALCLGPHVSGMVCVTDGSAGSVIVALGQMWIIPPHWTQSAPIDTCGAGDAWAAGVLFGLLYEGGDIPNIGKLAARSASAVISQHGPTLSKEEAARVIRETYADRFHLLPKAFHRTQSTPPSSYS
jgi:sugar/nucleoside kinase (ribokinase family)